MRHITKGPEPRSLSRKRADARRTPGLPCDLYSAFLDSETHDQILNDCLREQQGLCAYTGYRVTNGQGHVEHLVPRAVSCPKNPSPDFVERPFETIDWNNLVACFPENGRDCPFGAISKGAWPSDAEKPDFISPLQPGCEDRFRYGKRGTVRPSNSEDVAAQKTIEKLSLNHEWLREARKIHIEIDLKTPVHKRNKLLRFLEDRTSTEAPPFAFQRAQALRREWAGKI